MRNGSNNVSSIIDMSVSENAIREGRKQFCHTLSERLLLAMVQSGAGREVDAPVTDLVKRAWELADAQYEEMIRRRASENAPVSLSERMAADNIAAGAKLG